MSCPPGSGQPPNNLPSWVPCPGFFLPPSSAFSSPLLLSPSLFSHFLPPLSAYRVLSFLHAPIAISSNPLRTSFSGQERLSLERVRLHLDTRVWLPTNLQSFLPFYIELSF